LALLDDKAIVITGAGSGLGAAYARHAGSLGAEVLVNDIDERAAEATAADIRMTGGDAIALAGDVSSWEFAGSLIEQCLNTFGRIDGLVNNAGILRHGRITEMAEADFRAMLNVNTVGAAACAAHAIPAMLAAGRPASIVNVASGSIAGDIALGGYGASKAAVAALTFSWAMELKDTNVRVNAVSPLAHTAMAQSNMGYLAQQSANREIAYTTLPAAEINAPVIAFLLSDGAIGINGQIVRIAGQELSFVTHPMIAEPVLKGDWTDDKVAEAFRKVLAARQQKLGLGYARTG
jgi:NAD(P)-dependent dehydrogenase (short-subunit alcohol dehydrogenase family)